MLIPDFRVPRDEVYRVERCITVNLGTYQLLPKHTGEIPAIASWEICQFPTTNMYRALVGKINIVGNGIKISQFSAAYVVL